MNLRVPSAVHLDTVRHYEDCGLLVPGKVGSQKHYTEADVSTFGAIVAFKSVGFSLDEIKFFVDFKRILGCGSPALLYEVASRFQVQIDAFTTQIEQIAERRDNLLETLAEIVKVMEQRGVTL